MLPETAAVVRILGGEAVLRRSVRSLGDLRRAVADGLPVAALNRTVAYATTSRAEAAHLRDQLVPPATRKRRTVLKPVESERVERLARVVALAEQVWGGREEALAFLHAPHPLLGDRAPLDVARTELGAREVEELLWKLEYGLPV